MRYCGFPSTQRFVFRDQHFMVTPQWLMWNNDDCYLYIVKFNWQAMVLTLRDTVLGKSKSIAWWKTAALCWVNSVWALKISIRENIYGDQAVCFFCRQAVFLSRFHRSEWCSAGVGPCRLLRGVLVTVTSQIKTLHWLFYFYVVNKVFPALHALVTSPPPHSINHTSFET